MSSASVSAAADLLVGLASTAMLTRYSGLRLRDGRLRTIIGNVSTLDDAVAAFNSTERLKGKTIIRVRP
jgi:hypothetical protein